MTIDWAHFTPFSALAGGALIGLAAALLILGLGRVMGAAGIVGGALEVHDAEAPWRWSLIVGLVLSPLIARALWGVAAPVFAAPLAGAGRLRPAGRLRRAARLGLHQRPRRLRPGAPVAALVRRDRNLHGDGVRDRLRRPPRRRLREGDAS